MFGRLACALGFHRVVTTREGKTTQGQRGGPRTTGAAAFIHAYCYRPECEFHVIIDTHSGHKTLNPAQQ
jgi:hypothetical protein